MALVNMRWNLAGKKILRREEKSQRMFSIA